MERNTENIECFLFELNELMARHKAMIQGNKDGTLFVIAHGQCANAGRDWMVNNPTIRILQGHPDNR